jgi:endonuclease III
MGQFCFSITSGSGRSVLRLEHLLVTLGNNLYQSKSGYAAQLMADPQADSLVRDIENHPHAFVLACLMDRQMNADRAWNIPSQIEKHLGTFEFDDLVNHGREFYHRIFAELKLHRYNATMADVFYDALLLIENNYNTVASGIWENRPSSLTIVSRFREFKGCGQKIASMAANILVTDFRVPVSDYTAIDVSADVHVVRVFTRLKLVPEIKEQTKLREMVINKAREINPEFPGIVDLPCWMIGRQWCRPPHPDCEQCIVNSICERCAV